MHTLYSRRVQAVRARVGCLSKTCLRLGRRSCLKRSVPAGFPSSSGHSRCPIVSGSCPAMSDEEPKARDVRAFSASPLADSNKEPSTCSAVSRCSPSSASFARADAAAGLVPGVPAEAAAVCRSRCHLQSQRPGAVAAAANRHLARPDSRRRRMTSLGSRTSDMLVRPRRSRARPAFGRRSRIGGSGPQSARRSP
jgi:hypothetical protein